MYAVHASSPAFDAPPDGLNCRICGSSERPLAVAMVNGFAIAHCPRCQGESFQGIPTQATLARAYDGFDAGEIARANLREYVTLAKEIVRREMKFLGERRPEALRFLDYGCGGGHFVEAASLLAMDAAGMELDPQSVNSAVGRGLNVVQGSLPRDAHLLASASFDYIKCMHVLEHTPAPIEVLKEFRRLLRPNGIAVVSVPDQSSFPSRLKVALRLFGIKKREFGFIQPPIHLHGFSPESMRVAAASAGFEVIELRRTSPLDLKYFPTVPAYWSGIAIQKIVYQMGRLLMSPGHLTAVLAPA